MDSTFIEIYNFTKQWEGGKVVDPDDPGGATAFGVSFRFLQGLPLDLGDINGDGKVTWQDVMAMSEEDAEVIFRRYFWENSNIERLPLSLHKAMFDTAVNVGRKRAIRWLQFILGVEADGIIGTKTTLAAFKNIRRPVNAALLARRRAHYGDLAARREWARKYYKGWINRTAALEKLILGRPWVGGAIKN